MNIVTLALLLALTPAAWQSPQGSAPTTTAPNAQSTSPNTQNAPLSQKGIERIIKEVHHELVMLPFYGVFDNLAYKVSPDGTVTLLGQVSRPTLKSDAENVVKRIEGVERVDNQIKVLPLSNYDDEIRLRALRTIYGSSTLSKYALGANPPIHIIVDNGRVVLKGVVANTMDRQIAESLVRSNSLAFDVKNELQVETD